MLLVIDRFEGNFAVCENQDTKAMTDIPRADLPAEAREGMVLSFENGQYTIQEQATAERSEQVKKLLDSLWE